MNTESRHCVLVCVAADRTALSIGELRAAVSLVDLQPQQSSYWSSSAQSLPCKPGNEGCLVFSLREQQQQEDKGGDSTIYPNLLATIQ